MRHGERQQLQRSTVKTPPSRVQHHTAPRIVAGPPPAVPVMRARLRRSSWRAAMLHPVRRAPSPHRIDRTGDNPLTEESSSTNPAADERN